MNNHARQLLCTQGRTLRVSQFFSSPYQRRSFRILIALFQGRTLRVGADGRPHLSHAATKSASALSRFLNSYRWNARAIIRQTRRAAIDSLFAYYATRRGRRPRLLVMLDLTTLEKAGRFVDLGEIRTLNKKRGLHLVMMYLVAGPLRLPWALRVWRGRGSRSACELAVALLRTLPSRLTRRFRVLVLADSGFGSVEFLEAVHALEFDVVVGMGRSRRTTDGRALPRLRTGERVRLRGMSFPVTVARYRVRRREGLETRFVVATFVASGRTLSRWGRRRWRIEGFFKTAKGRFGLARFAQGTKLGVYRFLVLSLLGFVLSQWRVWSTPSGVWPAWGAVATALRRLLLPDPANPTLVVRAELLLELERLRPHLETAETPWGAVGLLGWA